MSERARHYVYLAAIPWIQLLINRNLFMTPGGNRYLDPWVYTGFFLSLPEHLHLDPGTYYGARLSWLLPGYVAHSIFSPLVANYVLHLGFFYVLLFTTYHLIESAVDRSAAIFVALVVAWSPIVLAAVSWDYVDGAGIVYTVVAIWCVEKSVRVASHHDLWAAAAGAMMTCMVSANIVLVMLWPILGLFAVLRTKNDRWSRLLRLVPAVIAGAVFIATVFAVANSSLGGSWFFWLPQIQASRSLLTMPSDYWIPVSDWILRATWLVTLTIAAIGALATLARGSQVQPEFARVMQVVLLVALIFWATVHSLGVPILQISYYSSYLAPFALIALPLQFGTPGAGLPRRTLIALELCTLTLFGFAHWVAASEFPIVWAAIAPWFDSSLWIRLWGSLDVQRQLSFVTWVGIGAGLLGLVLVPRLRSPALRWVALSVVLAFAFMAAPGDLPVATDRTNPVYFETTVAAHRFIEQQRGGRRLGLWYSRTDPASPVVGVVNTFFWGSSVLNSELPKLTQEQAATLERGREMILLAPRFDDVEMARASLRSFGYELDVVKHREFGSAEQPLLVVVAKLK